MTESLENIPPRLTLENQPSSEGAYREIGELRHAGDESCGFEILEDFERFNQANDIYTRGQWDPRIRSEKVINWFKGMFTPGIGVKESEGYGIKDFALKNAGWMSTNLVILRNRKEDRTDGFLDWIKEFCPPNEEKMPVESPEIMSAEVKKACKILGADAVGITSYDPRWHYTKNFSPNTLSEKNYGIPDGLPNVIDDSGTSRDHCCPRPRSRGCPGPRPRRPPVRLCRPGTSVRRSNPRRRRSRPTGPPWPT